MALDQSNLQLPRLLCLHGGGTSALIFKIQTRRLQWSLRSHFRFVFVDAPFESGAGPGVLPVFADCGPYYRWMSKDSPTMERDQQRVRAVLRKAIAEDAGTGDWVGVLGFSQGGMMTAGLLADQEEGEETGLPEWQFGVLLCASYPPLSLSRARSYTAPKGTVDEHGEVREPEQKEIIHIPSVHVRGRLDPHFEKGRRLAKFFDKDTSFQLEFVMGHNLPGAAGDVTSSKDDTDKIRDAILRVYEGDMKVKVPKYGSVYGNGVGLAMTT